MKQRIYASAEGMDVAIIEVGGTVGDIESLPFLETIRQIGIELGVNERFLFILLWCLILKRPAKLKLNQRNIRLRNYAPLVFNRISSFVALRCVFLQLRDEK